MPGNVQSVERAAAIIRLLSAHDGRQLGDLSSALGLSKSTVHGIVRTLVQVGFVEQEAAGGGYRLAQSVLANRPMAMDVNEIRARATNWVDALAARTRLATRLVVLPDRAAHEIDAGIISHHVFSAAKTPQHVEIGESVNLAATAEGKVLLAFAAVGPSVLEGLQPEAATSRTLTDVDRVRAEVDLTRSRGYGIDDEESAVRTAGLAVPVRSHGGLVVAALGVRGTPDQVLTARHDASVQLVTLLAEAARGTSHALMAERW